MADMTEIKGAQVVAAINQRLQQEIAGMRTIPRLAIVRVGERSDDLAYERGALKRMQTIGLRCDVFSFPAEIGQQEFAAAFQGINADPDVDGILLFRPLPKQLDEKAIIEIIDPRKDVDGMCAANMARVYAGDAAGFPPCTAQAVVEMLDFAGIDLKGKRVTVIGRSLVVGKPLAMLLLARNATVTVCHTRTVDMPARCREADIVVAAAGVAKMVGPEYVSSSSVVIDVGINVDDAGNLCGDVDYQRVAPVVSCVTPVPGGVGTVTTSVLASHVVRAAKMLHAQGN